MLFEDLKRKPYPDQMILDIHSYCNAKCVFCPYEHLSKINPMGVMEQDLFEKIVKDYSELSRQMNFKGKIIFCNMGELFYQADSAISRLKFVMDAGLAIDIQTNASLLTPKNTDKLLSTGFKGHILISFHGISDHVYKKLMGLNMKTTLKNIDYLVNHYSTEKISIQAIPYHWPIGEALRVRSFWKKMGLNVRMPLPNSRAGLVDAIKNKKKIQLTGCNSDRPLHEMIVCYNGDVILCCNDMSLQEKMGSLKTSTIEEVWNGQTMTRVIKQIYCGDSSPDNFICKDCEFAKTKSDWITKPFRNVKYEIKKFFLNYV